MSSVTRPDRAFLETAKRLLEHEARDAGEEPAMLATRVLRELVTHLATYVGDAGAEALLDRSVAVTARSWPSLAGATRGGEERWERLREALAATPGDVATHLLASLLGLFATLVGSALAYRILHRHRPEVIPPEPMETT